MNSQYALYCDPQGVIRVIEITGLYKPYFNPEEFREEEYEEHMEALGKAKKGSVEVKDQKLSNQLIYDSFIPSDAKEVTVVDLKPDTIYHIPGLKVKFWSDSLHSDVEIKGDGWYEWAGGRTNQIRDLKAIISVEESKTQEESQESLWDKVGAIMGHNIQSNGWEYEKSLLMDKFTIKRNK